MTRDPIANIVDRFVSPTDTWYLDTHETHTEVGIRNNEAAIAGILSALDERGIEYDIVGDGGEEVVVYIYQ